jgi:predicted nucleic acid-binding protein
VTLAELVSRHARVALDTNVLIYAIEGRGRESTVARAVLDALGTTPLSAIFSILGMAELLVGPAQADDAALVHRYADEIEGIEGLVIAPFSRAVAIEAALLRGTGAWALADAIHLATARASGATAFVTNDRGLRPIGELEMILLADLALPA